MVVKGKGVIGMPTKMDAFTKKDDNRLMAKNDNRLFPDDLLYCEGYPKTIIRGWLHTFCAVLLPLMGIWHIAPLAKGDVWGLFAAYGYSFTQSSCYMTSAVYHMIKLPPSSEIFIQKLDHCGIAFFEFGSFIPLYIILIPTYSSNVSILFFIMTFLALLSHAYHVFVKLDASAMRLALVGATILPFIPMLAGLLNDFEWYLMFMTIFFQLAGMAVFVFQRPDPFPSIFGFHEVFHTLVVCGGFSCYAANCSIINRICNS